MLLSALVAPAAAIPGDRVDNNALRQRLLYNKVLSKASPCTGWRRYRGALFVEIFHNPLRNTAAAIFPCMERRAEAIRQYVKRDKVLQAL